MRITGAVLEANGAQRPYADSRPLVVRELELDDPGPGELLVRLEAAGLCHSDLSVVDGSRERPLPMLLGHEGAGRVEAVGEGVDDLRRGQRVVLAFLPRCGRCSACTTDGRLPCSVGSAANNAGTLLRGAVRLHDADGSPVNHHLGVSAFATHAVVARASVVPVDDDVPAEVAALLGCAVLTGGGAVLNAGSPYGGASVAVVGLGGVGMAALLVALSLVEEGRVGTVIGVDAVDAKLTRARALGAHQTYTPEQAVESGVQADVVVEAAGHPRAFETAVALTAVGGTSVTVGLPSPQARSSIAPLDLVSGARTIVGSYLGSAVPARDIPTYAQLWRQGRLPVRELVSARIGLRDVNEALDALAEGHAVRQVILAEPTG